MHTTAARSVQACGVVARHARARQGLTDRAQATEGTKHAWYQACTKDTHPFSESLPPAAVAAPIIVFWGLGNEITQRSESGEQSHHPGRRQKNTAGCEAVRRMRCDKERLRARARVRERTGTEGVTGSRGGARADAIERACARACVRVICTRWRRRERERERKQ